MPGVVSVHKLSPLNIADSEGNPHYGADQKWYSGVRQRLSGCGPTVGASLLWYLARTCPSCTDLAPAEQTKEAMVVLMESVWRYIKPGIFGVTRTDVFRNGILRFAADRGVGLAANALNVPPKTSGRPSSAQVAAFLKNELVKGLPLAFLNLGSGQEKRLQNWHWMVLFAFSPDTLTGWFYDEGERREFDLELWLKSSPKGGGFVTVYPVDGQHHQQPCFL